MHLPAGAAPLVHAVAEVEVPERVRDRVRDRPGRGVPAPSWPVFVADLGVAQATRLWLPEGKRPGEVIGAPSREQAEIARLRRQLAKAEQKLATTEIALQIMGKAHALLEQISESADTDPKHEKR